MIVESGRNIGVLGLAKFTTVVVTACCRTVNLSASLRVGVSIG